MFHKKEKETEKIKEHLHCPSCLMGILDIIGTEYFDDRHYCPIYICGRCSTSFSGSNKSNKLKRLFRD